MESVAARASALPDPLIPSATTPSQNPYTPDACVALLEDAQCSSPTSASAALRQVAQHLPSPHPSVTRSVLDLCQVHPATTIPHIPDIISASAADTSAALHAFSALLESDRSLLLPVIAALSDLPLTPSDRTLARATLSFALRTVDDADVPVVVRAVARAAATPALARWAAATLRAGLAARLDASVVRVSALVLDDAARARPALTRELLRAAAGELLWLDVVACVVACGQRSVPPLAATALVPVARAVAAFPSHALHAARLAKPLLVSVPAAARRFAALLVDAHGGGGGGWLVAEADPLVAFVVEIVRALPAAETPPLVHHFSRLARSGVDLHGGHGTAIAERILAAFVHVLRPPFMQSTAGAPLPPDVLCRQVLAVRKPPSLGRAAPPGEDIAGKSAFGGGARDDDDDDDDDANVIAAGGIPDTPLDDNESDRWGELFVKVRKGTLFGTTKERAYALRLAESVVARSPPKVAADMLSLLDESIPVSLDNQDAVFFLRVLTVAASRRDQLFTPTAAASLFERRISAVVQEGVLTPAQGDNPFCANIDVGKFYSQDPVAGSIIVTAGVALLARATAVAPSAGKGQASEPAVGNRELLIRDLSVYVLVPKGCVPLYGMVDPDNFSTTSKRSKKPLRSSQSASVNRPRKKKKRQASKLSKARGSAVADMPHRPRRSSAKRARVSFIESDDDDLQVTKTRSFRGGSASIDATEEHEYVADDDDDDDSIDDDDGIDDDDVECGSGAEGETGGRASSELDEMPLGDLIQACQAFAMGVAVINGVMNFACHGIDEAFWESSAFPKMPHQSHGISSQQSVTLVSVLQERVTETSRMQSAFLRGMNVLQRRRAELDAHCNDSVVGQSVERLLDVAKSFRWEYGIQSDGPITPSQRLRNGAQSLFNDQGVQLGRIPVHESFGFPQLSCSAILSALHVLPWDSRRYHWQPESTYSRETELTTIEAMLLERLQAFVVPRSGHRSLKTFEKQCLDRCQFSFPFEKQGLDVVHPGEPHGVEPLSCDESYKEEIRLYEKTLAEVTVPSLLKPRSELRGCVVDDFVSKINAAAFSFSRVDSRNKPDTAEKATGNNNDLVLPAIVGAQSSAGECVQSADNATWKRVGVPTLSMWECDDAPSLLLSHRVIALLLDRAAMHAGVASEVRRQLGSQQQGLSHLQESTAAASFALHCLVVLLERHLDCFWTSSLINISEGCSERGTVVSGSDFPSAPGDWTPFLTRVERVTRWDPKLFASAEDTEGDSLRSRHVGGINVLQNGSKTLSLLRWVAETAVDETLSTMAFDAMFVLAEMGCVEVGAVRELLVVDLQRVHEYQGDTLWPRQSHCTLLSDFVPGWVNHRRLLGLSPPAACADRNPGSYINIAIGGRTSCPWFAQRYRISSLFCGLPACDAVHEASVWVGALTKHLRATADKPQRNDSARPSIDDGRARSGSTLFSVLSVESVVDFLLDVCVASLALIDIPRSLSARRANRKSKSPIFALRSRLLLFLDTLVALDVFRSSLLSGGADVSAVRQKDELYRLVCTKATQALASARGLVGRLGPWYSNTDVQVSQISEECMNGLREIVAISSLISRASTGLANSVKAHAFNAPSDGCLKKKPGHASAVRPPQGPVRKSALSARRVLPRLLLHAEGLGAAAHQYGKDIRLKQRALDRLENSLQEREFTKAELGSGVGRWRRRAGVLASTVLSAQPLSQAMQEHQVQSGVTKGNVGGNIEEPGTSSDDDDASDHGSDCSDLGSHHRQKSPYGRARGRGDADETSRHPIGTYWASGTPVQGSSDGNLVETETIMVSFRRHDDGTIP